MATFNRFFAPLFALLLLTSCATHQQQVPRYSVKELVTGSKATAFVWWATQCPCVARYESRIEALAKDFASKGVKFYVVASNSDDDQERIEAVALKRGFSLPILIDSGGQLAVELGARTTPTVVIVDQDGEVQYRGWIDNERRIGEKGRVAYVETALQELVDNKTVSSKSSPIYGCRITKRLR